MTPKYLQTCVCRYGPETYNLKRVSAGKYVIQANYYGSQQQKMLGPATIKAAVFSNYGENIWSFIHMHDVCHCHVMSILTSSLIHLKVERMRFARSSQWDLTKSNKLWHSVSWTSATKLCLGNDFIYLFEISLSVILWRTRNVINLGK